MSEALPPDAMGGPKWGTPEELARYQAKDRGLDLVAKEDNIISKRQMGKRVFWLVTIWLAVIILILTIAGFGGVPFITPFPLSERDIPVIFSFLGGHLVYVHKAAFQLSDTVLVTLIATTTTNVALFLTKVITHLFPETGKNNSE